MRVSAKNVVEISRMKVFPEDVDSVSAIEAERSLFQKFVPELFEPDRGRKLLGFPENSDHFAVSSLGRAIAGRAKLPHGRAHSTLEQAPVRLAAHQELRESLL